RNAGVQLPDKWAAHEIEPKDTPRVIRDYLDTPVDEAFGAATTAKRQTLKPNFTYARLRDYCTIFRS
ncbi:MAG: hypothetical protein AAFR72_13750, partial [Pseudomonadota bacterium]